MISAKDIAWVAGIVEGEGYLYCAGKSCPVIRVGMTDKDIIDRLSTMFGVKTSLPIAGKPENGRPRKTQWRSTVCGDRAAGWMMTIYPLMGDRRSEKIRNIISKWKSVKRAVPFGGRPLCHPERKHHVHGYCNRCWLRIRNNPNNKGKSDQEIWSNLSNNVGHAPVLPNKFGISNRRSRITLQNNPETKNVG